ncbi:superoxide dismutase family protein [Larkinella insperata]|uniref:Superoxide dismutase family protein n=1 Tax=Larkinella insperata TaxID=332158 RepID=A0ABW3QM79_9BACT
MFRPVINPSPAQKRSQSLGDIFLSANYTFSRAIRWISFLPGGASFLVLLSMASSITGCRDHQDPSATATVSLISTSGSNVGSAEMTEDKDGMVTLKVNVTSLPAGSHGIHFHEIGAADPQAAPAFATSGEHYNPASRKHGLENPEGTHAGDLPNLVVDAQGRGSLVTTTDRITLTDGPKTLFDANGSSLIIHASIDDQKTDPSGNSGPRIAGGVVERK